MTPSTREKYLIMLAAAALGLFILIQFVFFPFMDHRKRLKERLSGTERALEEMVGLKSEYDRLQTVSDREKPSGKTQMTVSLFSFVEKVAGETGMKNRIAYMKPSNLAQKGQPYKIQLVEMKFEGITLVQLAKFLQRVEYSGKKVSLRRMSVGKEKEAGTLTAVIQLQTLEVS